MKKTVLVVDDSDFVRKYHSCILEQADFAVLTAIDGGDGLEKLLTHRCDLVLTDLNMGRMDGFEFIRRVRAETGYQELPIVVASTAVSTPSVRVQAMEAGANLLLPKPCSPETMVAGLRALLTQVTEEPDAV
jgi:two-component system, chemotaxis family, chemotaxis protein CheY